MSAEVRQQEKLDKIEKKYFRKGELLSILFRIRV